MIFIAKPTFFKEGLNGKSYPVRLSTRPRAEEIARYLGGISTQENTPGELRIHIKPMTLRRVKTGEYVDILDDRHLIERLKQRPDVRVIVYSQHYLDYLKGELTNELILIPHHHINIENKTRIKNEVLTAGVVGKPVPAAYSIIDPIAKVLDGVGIKLINNFDCITREDMLNFYNQIDFQVIWYPEPRHEFENYFRHSGKIVNAASFGIPTLAQDILGHRDMGDFYIPVRNYDDIVREALKLQDDNYYSEWSEKLINKAKEYHISEIAKLYKELK